jgi:hypothetical protein
VVTDLASCEGGDVAIGVGGNVPWEDRLRFTGNENSQKTLV